jgi:MFS family permease
VALDPAVSVGLIFGRTALSDVLDEAVAKTKWRLVPLMLALYILAFLDRVNIGFAKQAYQHDTGISNEAFAFGAGIFFVAYAALGVPANLMMKRFGAKRWIGLTTVIWGALSVAGAFADKEWKFITVRFLFGAAEAGFFPGMIYMASKWFPQSKRSTVIGLLYMGPPLALTIGSPLSGALLEMNGVGGFTGWFWMFVVEGLLAVAVGIIAFFFLDDSPAQARFLNPAERDALMEQLSAEGNSKSASSIAGAIRDLRVWHLALIYAIIQITAYGVIFFLPTQVASLLGTTVGFKASLVAAVPWLTALVSTYLVPRISDQTGDRRRVAALTLLLSGIGIGVSGFAAPLIAIAALCIAAAGFIAVQPVFWTIPADMLSENALAAGIGFIAMFGAIGSFVAPMIRVKADTFFANPSAGLLVLGVITIIGAAAIMQLRQVGANHSPKA